MNDIISEGALEARRAKYKPGTRVELVRMEDPYTTLKPGDRGTVDLVDDIGSVAITWDIGSTLGAAYRADEIRLLTKAEIIREQARKVADTGLSNMFATKAVFEIAVAMDFYELADFIFMDTKRYANLILTGELDDVE